MMTQTVEIPTQFRSFKFCKVYNDSKRPVGDAWQLNPLNFDEITRWFRSGNTNYGIIAGYEKELAIDFDDPLFYEQMSKLLPDTFTTRSPNRGFHLHFICNDIEALKKVSAKCFSLEKDGVHLGEVRFYHVQTIGPGSIHATTKTPYEVFHNVPINEITAEQILSVFAGYYKERKVSTYTGPDNPAGEELILKAIYGLELSQNNGNLMGSHPVHGSETGQNFSVTPSKGVWCCFRHNTGGDAISLVAVREGIINCEDSQPGGLVGEKFKKALKIAGEKYGIELKKKDLESPMIDTATDTMEKVFRKVVAISSGTLALNIIAREIQCDNELIYCNGFQYQYSGGVYKEIGKDYVHKIIKEKLSTEFSLNKVAHIYEAVKLDTLLDRDKELNASGLLNVKNGMLNLDTLELLPHSPEYRSTIQLDVNYDPNATAPKWFQTLKEIFYDDPRKMDILQEYFGLCLTKDMRQEKAFFMVGEGANGKSTVLYILQRILGKENYSCIPLESLNNPNYVANLYQKLANISIETNAKSSVYDSIFKAIISGDQITADLKFMNAFKFAPVCKLIFALNHLPRVDDKSNAFYRRLLILRFCKEFGETEQNKNLKKELESEVDGIFIWMLHGLKRLNQRGYFEQSEEMKTEVAEYQKDNNSILSFVDEKCDLDKNTWALKDALFLKYQEWSKESGLMPLGKIKFGKELQKLFKNITDDRTGQSRKWNGISLKS